MRSITSRTPVKTLLYDSGGTTASYPAKALSTPNQGCKPLSNAHAVGGCCCLSIHRAAERANLLGSTYPVSCVGEKHTFPAQPHYGLEISTSPKPPLRPLKPQS